MPLPIFLSLMLLPSGPPQIIDQSIAAFRARKSFSVQIALDAKLDSTVTHHDYKLSYEAPSRVLLTKVIDGRNKLVFWLDNKKFFAYDPAAGEVAERAAPAAGPIVNRVANAVGGIEDPVTVQLSPDSLATFLGQFKRLGGWTATRQGNSILLKRPGTLNGKKTLTEFDFQNSSKLLTRVLFLGPVSRLEWKFNYGPSPRNLSFSFPKGTKHVEALTEHAPIDAADAKAHNTADRCLRAYAHLRSAVFTMTGTRGTSQNWVSDGSVRQKTAQIDWSFHAGKLSVHDYQTGKSYYGSCKPDAVATYLHRLGFELDPEIREILMKRNPISRWFVQGTTVSSHGLVQLGKMKAEALEIRSHVLDISLLVRTDTDLIASVTSRVTTPKGELLSETEKDFSYDSVNKPIASTLFAVPLTKALPLTDLAK